MSHDIGRPIDIDLLQPEEQPGARRALTDTLFTALVVLVVAFLAPILWLLNDVRVEATALTRRLTIAQQAMKQLAVTPTEVVTLRQELESTQKRVAQLEADLTTIGSRRISWGTAMRSIWQERGPNVSVTSVRTEGRTVTVKGDASGLDAVSGYVDRLRATGHFINVIIEMVTSQRTPLPVPPPSPPPPLPSPTPTQTPIPPPPTATATQLPTGVATPQPTWTPLPTYTPFPTFTQLPTSTATPTHTPTRTNTPVTPSATPTRTPVIAVRLRDIVFYPTVVPAGGTLRVELTVDNIGNVPLSSQDQPPPGYTYNEGASSPPGMAGFWRVAADVQSMAMSNAHRYRWGLGGNLLPARSRRVIGYIRLATPGTYYYCVGIVQEFVSWRSSCEGLRVITVTAPTPTRTPTVVVTPTATRTPTVVLPTPTRTPTPCADGYEPDNVWTQARVIGANSSLPQRHNFHVSGDTDWVKFAVSPNVTYTLRTLDLTGGNDTIITLYGLDGGVLYQIAQNDEDPANSTMVPPVVGPSRIDYRVTTTDTARFGTTLYARINSPNPTIYGCDKSYGLRLTSATAMGPGGAHLVRMVMPPATDQIDHAAVVSKEEQQWLPLSAPQAQRVGFTIILELRGGAP